MSIPVCPVCGGTSVEDNIESYRCFSCDFEWE